MTQISESKNRHIVILTGQHACANPRVWKEANLLSKLGYKVTVLTLFYSVEKLKLDKKLIDNANVTKVFRSTLFCSAVIVIAVISSP